jgi:hypothetical protein
MSTAQALVPARLIGLVYPIDFSVSVQGYEVVRRSGYDMVVCICHWCGYKSVIMRSKLFLNS